MRVYGVGILNDIPSPTAKRLGGVMLQQEIKLYYLRSVEHCQCGESASK